MLVKRKKKKKKFYDIIEIESIEERSITFLDDLWMMNRNFIYKSCITGRKKIFISGAAVSRIFSDEKPRSRIVHLSLSDCTDEFSIRQTFSQARFRDSEMHRKLNRS